MGTGGVNRTRSRNAAAVREGTCVLLVARVAESADAGEGDVVGTAQLLLATRQNARHRAEVAKVIVHTKARRRGLGRALLTKPKLLMLDEPTEGIQPSIILEIEDALRRIKRELGLAVLLVEQYLDFAERLADKYVIMAKGAVVASGSTGDLRVEMVRQHLAV